MDGEFETTAPQLPFPKTGALILVVVLVFLLGGYFGLNFLSTQTQANITDLTKQNKDLKAYFTSGISGEANVRTISQTIHLNGLIQNHAYPTRFLALLEQNIPQNVTLSNLTADFTKGTLTFSASVNDVAGFAGAVTVLNKSAFFVTPQIAIQSVDFQKNVVTFTVTSNFSLGQ